MLCLRHVQRYEKFEASTRLFGCCVTGNAFNKVSLHRKGGRYVRIINTGGLPFIDSHIQGKGINGLGRRQLDVIDPILECIRERIPYHVMSYHIFSTWGSGGRSGCSVGRCRGALSITRSCTMTKRKRADKRKEREQDKLKKHQKAVEDNECRIE